MGIVAFNLGSLTAAEELVLRANMVAVLGKLADGIARNKVELKTVVMNHDHDTGITTLMIRHRNKEAKI